MDDHPTAQDLDGFVLGTHGSHRAESSRWVVRHLLSGCALCRQRIAKRLQLANSTSARRSSSVPSTARASLRDLDYDQAFARAEHVLSLFLSHGRPAHEPPKELLAELTPFLEDSVMPSRNSLALPALVKWLIARSHGARYGNPQKMLEYGLLARLASDSCSVTALGKRDRLADLRARAWGQLGNALRVNGQIRNAAEMFSTAQNHAACGTGDPSLRAQLLSQRASLHIFQRNFTDALDCAETSNAIHESLGDPQGAASALIVYAVANVYSGEPDKALEALRGALPLVDARSNPDLFLAIRHNMVRCYIDLGRPARAQSIRTTMDSLIRRSSAEPLTSLRSEWQEGILLYEIGHPEPATAVLRRVRDGFVQLGLAYETAVLSLELATVYASLGQRSDETQMAREAIPIFKAMGIQRESLASLAHLQ